MEEATGKGQRATRKERYINKEQKRFNFDALRANYIFLY